MNPIGQYNQNYIMFTFSLQHTTCITIYWLNQPISFYSVPDSNSLLLIISLHLHKPI